LTDHARRVVSAPIAVKQIGELGVQDPFGRCIGRDR
jgi:hypothetical protein